ncbi:hypothetical protein A9P82_10080 [Arachidicoccus ginsenosidimutans]|uniref:nucleoid-associated protein n=1 Tax=Arachidicoccus sp. BS20 TaxID=1850526 RepID=UPI0007F0B8EA|nr:nucleoid-associated protein [Arachidicoccus sp. BS20]ANI89606.1 hypothetical protein A9P82_10080 [Arachidicoccus sp. BS20]
MELNLSIHKVGNKETETLSLSGSEIAVNQELSELLTTYFLSSFKSEEYYQLHHDADLALNEVYAYVSAIFDNVAALHEQSINLAKHLYNQSTHPKIKGGEFYVAYFKDAALSGDRMDAVGLFKSENKDTFLKVFPKDEGFEIESEQGININKLDKGCIIFNTEKENGYIVSVVDNTNKGAEAQYWTDNFLHLRQRQDKYYNTENTMSLYKDYIVKQLPEEYSVTRADQADFLNRSMKFFKEKDNFELDEFKNEVLQYPEYINSFDKYKEEYEKERDIEIADNFTISDAAVKRQNRSYKSVIKLDKNFHIYVHGNRELIEHGIDEKGRKFYKIYYETES